MTGNADFDALQRTLQLQARNENIKLIIALILTFAIVMLICAVVTKIIIAARVKAIKHIANAIGDKAIEYKKETKEDIQLSKRDMQQAIIDKFLK